MAHLLAELSDELTEAMRLTGCAVLDDARTLLARKTPSS